MYKKPPTRCVLLLSLARSPPDVYLLEEEDLRNKEREFDIPRSLVQYLQNNDRDTMEALLLGDYEEVYGCGVEARGMTDRVMSTALRQLPYLACSAQEDFDESLAINSRDHCVTELVYTYVQL